MQVGKIFGEAGKEVVVEEFLEGEEASFFALVDGTSALPLASAQDHKAAYDGDKGPNTGGMGAYSPAPVFTPEVERQVTNGWLLVWAGLHSRGGAPGEAGWIGGWMRGLLSHTWKLPYFFVMMAALLVYRFP